jgi:hypothetical protein
MSKRLIWALVAIFVLLLALAPLASYCMGREEDYRDKGELRAPHHKLDQTEVVTGPLIRYLPL